MKFNAGRQSFTLSVVSAGAFAFLFAARYLDVPYPFETPVETGMPAARWLTRFSTEHPAWSNAAICVLAIWTAYVLIRLTVRYASATSRNYLPIQLFVIAACGMAFPGQVLTSFLAALLLALATRRFMSVLHKDYRFEEAFRGGLCVGLITLLYAPGAVLLLSIPALMSLYRRSGRELCVSLIGAIIPVLGAWFIMWVSGESVSYLFTEWWSAVLVRSFVLSPSSIPLLMYVCAGLAVAMVGVAIIWFAANRKGMRTRGRKAMVHTSLIFILIAISLAMPGSSLVALPMLSVPAAMVIPYAFTGKQALASTVAWCLLILAVLALNFSSLSGFSLI